MSNRVIMPLSSLVQFVRKNGYDFEIVKMTIQEMLRNGELYKPRDGYVRLTPM